MIDLGIGDPDLPTPAPILDYMARAAREPARTDEFVYRTMKRPARV